MITTNSILFLKFKLNVRTMAAVQLLYVICAWTCVLILTHGLVYGQNQVNPNNPLLALTPYPPIAPAQEATAMRILTMDVKDMTLCQNDEDCSNPNKPVCHQLTRLCKSTVEAGFDPIYGSCVTDIDCQPMYRCHGSKCHFSGPKACTSRADCLTGHEGLLFACGDLPLSAPGKRCYLKCNLDRDCHECDAGNVCRLPLELQSKIACCEGFCQRKVACGAPV